MDIQFSLLASEETNKATQTTLSLKAFLESFSHYEERENKRGPCWSPFLWAGNKRAEANAQHVTSLVFDLDWGKPGGLSHAELELSVRALLNQLEGLGCCFALHETYTQGSFRLVIPLDAPLTASMHSRYHQALSSNLSIKIDSSCTDLARVYYLPAHPVGSPRKVFLSDPSSKPIECNSIRVQVPAQESRSSSRDGELSTEASVISVVRQNASRLKAESRGLVLSCLDGSLVLRKGEREIKLHQLVSALTSCMPPPSGWDEVKTLLTNTLQSIEGVNEEGEDYFWKRAKRSFTKAIKFKQKKQSEREEREKFFHPTASPELDWRVKLLTTDTRGGPVTKSCTFNLDLILEHDPAFKGYIRFNELKRRVEVGGMLGRCRGDKGLELSNWLQSSEYQLDIPADKCGQSILQAAKRNNYNPVGEYINGLEWDGLKRVDDFLSNYCGVEGNAKYIRSISRKFFISAAARAIEPGCKVDTTLVLHGPMGTKKTSLIETLSKGWYTTMSHRLEDKDTRMQTTGAWFVELSELSSLSKSGVEHIRGFLTQRSDHLRLPYGREIEEFPRRCVFVGTTNSDYPLTDPEGNRRYWVVSCGDINLPMVERTVDQLWAEAAQLFREYQDELESVAAGTLREVDMKCRWWLSREEQDESNAENSIYELEDLFVIELSNWLRRPVQNRPDTLTPSEALIKVLRWTPREVQGDMPAQQRMGRAMRRLKWVKCSTGPKSSRVRAYRVPEVNVDAAVQPN